MDSEVKNLIRKWALQNAVKFNGNANPGAVIGKLISEMPEIKEKLKEFGKDIQAIIKDVNTMPNDAQLAELQKIAPELLEEKEHEKREGFKPLEGAVKGKCAFRIEPSPSGTLSIAHAYGIGVNYSYAKMYDGKFFVRIADTNPDNIYPLAYELIPRDANWLTENGITEVVVQSDRLGLYYDAAEKLISQGNAYVCTCSSDDFRTLINDKKACSCRGLPVKNHLERWAKMFGEFKPGEAVVRIKTDVEHPNPAMRDWPAVRINDHVHTRQGTKHRVWPLMNLSVAVDDHDMGISHVINGKEHADNAKRQKYVFDYMGWTRPTYMNWGRINFVGGEAVMSKSKTKTKIQNGEFDGWDDIRLPFLPALRRRGYQPGAFMKMAMDLGLTLNDKTVTMDDLFKVLNAHNKTIIDPISSRYFFIEDPIEITIKDMPKMKIELNKHPDFPKHGKRTFEVHDKFFIQRSDWARIKNNEMCRLMDCANFMRRDKLFVFDSKEYEKYKTFGDFIMHWLPAGIAATDLANIEVLMPDKTLRKGVGESTLKDLKKGDIVQFERFGFCALDKKEKDKLVFWFAHR